MQEVTIQMRKLDQDPAKQPLVLSLRMKNQSELCVARIVKLLKDDGMTMKQNFEPRRKILESEVTQAAYEGLEIQKLVETISEWETKLSIDRTVETANHLQALLSKAIEYYSASGNMHEVQKNLQKLKMMFSEPGLVSSQTAEAGQP